MKKDRPLHERPSVLERLILFVRRGNLHARSVWILLVSSVLPILIIGFGVFSGARYLFEQYNYNSIQKSMDLYGMLLDSQLSQYAQIGDEIAANLNTISIVANRHANNTAQYARIGEQYQYIEKLFIRHMIAVEIVADDGCVMFQPYQFTNPDAQQSAYYTAAMASPSRNRWFGACTVENPSPYTRPPASMSDDEIIFSTKIRALTGEYIGIVHLIISGNMLESILTDALAYESDASFPFSMRTIFIVDGQNRVLSGENMTTGETLEPALAQALETDGTSRIYDNQTGRTSLVFHAGSMRSDFRVVSVIDYDDFMGEINALQHKVFWLVGLLELFAAGIWYLHSLSIRKPITAIVEGMRRVENNCLKVRVEDGGNDELHYLAERFNAMVAQIQRLLSETIRIEASKREAEIRVLEEQINPHFLYNTLDMISWMAYQSKTEEIQRTVDALSGFFRLSLNRGRGFYRVEDELEHVQAYLQIQEERFHMRSHICWHVEADRQARSMKTIKIVLQPLVENAITHGLLKKSEGGNIWIRAWVAGEVLMMSVEDDGVGIGHASAPQPGFHSGCGLSNLAQRLKQYYGQEHGVSVTERPGGGTRAVLSQPAVKWEEEEGDVHGPAGG